MEQEAGDPDAYVVESDVWAAAADPELPPGVVAILCADGGWARYPLVEFMVDE